MTFYYKSESEVAPVPPPDKPPAPPLVIWGPGDPRPTLPIAGWNPGTGAWPDRPPQPSPPPEINTDPMPSNPIAEPPWGWGQPAPVPPVDPLPGWKIVYFWSPSTGWAVVAVPQKPIPVPSKAKK